MHPACDSLEVFGQAIFGNVVLCFSPESDRFAVCFMCEGAFVKANEVQS